jgi:hypothetical protein
LKRATFYRERGRLARCVRYLDRYRNEQALTGTAGGSPAACVTTIIIETRNVRSAKRTLIAQIQHYDIAPSGRDARAPGMKLMDFIAFELPQPAGETPALPV